MVNLYNLIYGMELYKPRFQSDDAYLNASIGLIDIYDKAHSMNQLIGPVDFGKIRIDLNTGEILSFPKELVPKDDCKYDQWKFYPQEYYSGVEWNIKQDHYCLAVILFCLRYYSMPYDGAEELKSFSLDANQRKEKYNQLLFVFADDNHANVIESIFGSNTVALWRGDENSIIKSMFVTTFGNRSSSDQYPKETEWRLALGVVGEKEISIFKLVNEEICIMLADGLEVLRKDISPYEDDRKLGVVVSSNKDKNVIALGNVSEDTWRVELPDGQRLSVAPKSAAPITKGATIDFGFGKVTID